MHRHQLAHLLCHVGGQPVAGQLCGAGDRSGGAGVAGQALSNSLTCTEACVWVACASVEVERSMTSVECAVQCSDTLKHPAEWCR